jgi:hypothetical protein
MGTTLADLHRIAAHVLGRRRFEVSGHFGLRASPDGMATPAFGPEPEVLRLAGRVLVREVGGDAWSLPIEGSTMAALAQFAGADLAAEFSAGPDTPPLGALDAVLHLVPDELDALYRWFDLGWRVLDQALYGSPTPFNRSTVQLWPEHFDAATAVELRPGSGFNLGFSPGDSFSPEPYVYVGPWGRERPGDPAYWNAPFGAFAPQSQVPGAPACLDFLRRGADALAGGEPSL